MEVHYPNKLAHLNSLLTLPTVVMLRPLLMRAVCECSSYQAVSKENLQVPLSCPPRSRGEGPAVIQPDYSEPTRKTLGDPVVRDHVRVCSSG
jgi:hypothetical protein